MMTKLRTLLAIGMAAVAPAHATGIFDGKPLEEVINYPTIDDVFPGSTYQFMVNEGQQYGDISQMIFAFSGNTITFHFPFATSFSGAYNGFRLRDYTGTISDFASVTLSSAIPGLTQSDVLFDSNAIWVNMADVAFPKNEVFSLTVNGAVPEVTSWAMMLTGFGVVGGAVRARRRAAIARPRLA